MAEVLRCRLVFGLADSAEWRAFGDMVRNDVRGIRVAEARVGSATEAPLTRRFDGGALSRRELFVQRWSSGRPRAREERRLSDLVWRRCAWTKRCRGLGRVRCWSATHKVAEGGSLLAGAAHRKVILGSQDGGRRASTGDSERETVRLSVSLRSGMGLQPSGVPHKGRSGGSGSLV